MKKSLYTGAAVLAVTAMLGSCSSDYLDVNPKTDINVTQLSDPSVAHALAGGIFECMNQQYSAYEVNQNVGEANVNQILGDCCGADYIGGLWNNMPGLRTWSYMNEKTAYAAGLPWMYYYGLINLSNYLIEAIPATSEDLQGMEGAILFYKAQALTMRAHSYTRLLGYFGQRWEDSKNGEAYCIVLRKEPGTYDTPLVTMNKVLQLIYEDCEEACKLYDISATTRDNMWECDKSVALGVWARAALIKHDWKTAADKAAEARKGYTIMSEKDLFAGFFHDTSETMWSMNPESNTTYYWSWGSHYACNGAYINNWQIGAGAITLDLYNQLDPNDLRRKFFWTPDKIKEVKNTFNKGKMTEKDFWNPKVVDATNYLNMAFTDVYDRTGKNPNGIGMLDCLAWWLNDYRLNVYTGDLNEIANDDNQYNSFQIDYKGSDTKKCVRLGNDANGKPYYAKVFMTPFGVQNKFWAFQPYGNMAMPWMRASEMALTEAEALYELGNESGAQAALSEVQTKRITGYTAKNSGEALRDEIRICRRIELWGEGIAFLDLKRWNVERIRTAWEENNPNSGNVPPTEFSGYDENSIKRIQSTKYSNGWRFAIPQREIQYNKAIDETLLESIKY